VASFLTDPLERRSRLLRRPPATGPAGAPHRKAFGDFGFPLEPHLRSRLEHGLGARLPDIRIHTGWGAAHLASAESARAVTYGSDIGFDSGEYRPGTLSGDALLAHEAAHAAQQAKGGGLAAGASEQSANRATVTALLRWAGSSTGPAYLPGSGLALRRCSKTPDVERALDGSIPWTRTLAQQALDQYRSMSDADRQKTFDRYYPGGTLQAMLAALAPEDTAGPYADMIRDLTRRAQSAGVMQSAQASGMANEAQMAQKQADFMLARNQAAAQALHPSGPPPTTTQVAAQQQHQVAATSIAPSVSTLSPADVASWTARANTAVTKMVTYSAAHHPELHLFAADFHVDVVGIESRGAGVIAYGEVLGGRHVVVVGRPFVRYVEANPAYAIDTVVHELHGHPEYGPYGTPGTEYGLRLYDLAAARMPGYTQPAAGSPGRTSELDAYAYQETEIYSLLRQLPYHVPLAPADVALSSSFPDPEGWVRARIGIIKRQWEPSLAQALLHGLYRRLQLDPRISAEALRAFERGVRANYTGKEAPIANSILR
jgi:hypothetical protein